MEGKIEEKRLQHGNYPNTKGTTVVCWRGKQVEAAKHRLQYLRIERPMFASYPMNTYSSSLPWGFPWYNTTERPVYDDTKMPSFRK